MNSLGLLFFMLISKQQVKYDRWNLFSASKCAFCMWKILLNYLDPIVIFILHEHLHFLLYLDCYNFFPTLKDNFFKLSPRLHFNINFLSVWSYHFSLFVCLFFLLCPPRTNGVKLMWFYIIFTLSVPGSLELEHFLSSSITLTAPHCFFPSSFLKSHFSPATPLFGQ